MAGLRPRGRETPPGVGRGGRRGTRRLLPKPRSARTWKAAPGAGRGGLPGAPVPRRLCCRGEPFGTPSTLVRALPTRSLAGMCARRGNLLPKQMEKKKKRINCHSERLRDLAVATELGSGFVGLKPSSALPRYPVAVAGRGEAGSLVRNTGT